MSSDSIVGVFVLDDDNKAITELLIKYFNNDDCGLDLRKGICIQGNVGSGKTDMLRIFQKCNFPNRKFGIKECRDMSENFLNENYKGIHPYGKGAIGVDRKLDLAFDDLGSENEINYYGNKVNAMAEIITDRYKHYVNHHLITHFTTNLKNDEIASKYGERVLSRMRQMVNFIVLGGEKNSKDRRKL